MLGGGAVATVEVPPPAAVLGRLEEQARYPHTKGPVRLTLPQLVAWVRACLQGASLPGAAALEAPSTVDGVRGRG